MSKLKNFFFLLLSFIIIFEIFSFIIYKSNILEISHKPKIYLPKNYVPNDEWWTEEKIWVS